MGFEVEKNRRNKELWDRPEVQPDSEQSVLQKQPIPQKGSVPQKNSVSKKNLPRRSKKSNSVVLVIVLTLAFIVIAIILTGVLMAVRRNRTEPDVPIALSTRLELANDFIPIPDGMEIGKCEIQGLYNLVIDVSGKTVTERRDYTTGSAFAFSLFDEVKSVTFTEKDTGKVYEFERPGFTG